MVMIDFRGVPVFNVNGVRGEVSTESAAEGWAIRRTVTGGPDVWENLTAKVKFRSPGRGRDISSVYVTDTLCDGQGAGGPGGGCGRVRYRLTPAAARIRADVPAMAVRRWRSRRGVSRNGSGAAASWS